MSTPRFLLVGLSNIGDVVMTTAVLEALHACEPGAVIDIVGDRRSSEILSACPYLGRVLHKDKRSPLRGLPGLVAGLRRTRYDLVVDLRTDFLPLLLRARRRLYRWHGRHAAGPHAVQRHLAVVAGLCPAAANAAPRLWLRAGDAAFARTALGSRVGRRLLALGPGANWSPKIWPAAGFIELIVQARDAFDAVVLLGSAADRPCAVAIESASVLPCVNLAGETDLLQSAAVVANARAFVGNDSGLGHIAATMGVATLTLFGPGDPLRYHPWGRQAGWLVEPAGDLARLPAAAVAAALAALLQGQAVAGSLPGGR